MQHRVQKPFRAKCAKAVIAYKMKTMHDKYFLKTLLIYVNWPLPTNLVLCSFLISSLYTFYFHIHNFFIFLIYFIFFCGTEHWYLVLDRVLDYTHSSLSSSSGMKKFGYLKILMRTYITKTSMELFQSPQKNFLRQTDSRWSVGHRSVESVKEKGTWVFMTIFFALEQLHGSFSDIGAHLEFQKPEFVIPELLLKDYDYTNICLKKSFTSHTERSNMKLMPKLRNNEKIDMSLRLWKLKALFRQCLINSDVFFTKVHISRHWGHTTKKNKLSFESWMFQLSSGSLFFLYHAFSVHKCKIKLKIKTSEVTTHYRA